VDREIKNEYAKDISRYIRLLYLQRRRFINAHISHKKIHGSMFTMLIFLKNNPGANQDMLCKDLRIDKSNITRMCHQLETMGYITREQSQQDKRRNVLKLTEKGESVIPEYFGLLTEWHNAATEGMSVEERETLLKLLARMMENIEDLD